MTESESQRVRARCRKCESVRGTENEREGGRQGGSEDERKGAGSWSSAGVVFARHGLMHRSVVAHSVPLCYSLFLVPCALTPPSHFSHLSKYIYTQVPDIYDSAKYDMLHNVHLPLSPTLEQLYREAKILADAVIPNE